MTVVVQTDAGPGFVVRAIWFLLVGWWLSGVAIFVGYVAALSVIGLPLAFWIFNRMPAIITLRPRSQTYVSDQIGDAVLVRAKSLPQRPLLLRLVYFVLVGFWLGLIWLTVAWILSLSVIGLPIALLMYNRVGGIMTLLRY